MKNYFRFIGLTIGAMAQTALIGCHSAIDASTEPVRNIVFILADDLGVMDLVCYGSDYYETPHLEALGLAPLLTQTGTMNRNTLYWHYPHYQTLPPHSAVCHHQWKLIQHHGEDARLELFNLEEDPGEMNDLSGRYPDITEKLLTYLFRRRLLYKRTQSDATGMGLDRSKRTAICLYLDSIEKPI